MWRLSADLATFAVGPLSGTVHPARPDRGIHDLSIAGVQWPGACLLQVGMPTPNLEQVQVAETYLRDCDLVATYTPLPPFTVQPQLYWRLRTSEAHRAVGVELIVSVQTSLLFSEPQTTVSCGFAPLGDETAEGLLGADELADSPGLLAVPTIHPDYVLVQIVHPADLHSVERQRKPDGSLNWRAQLFQEHLEKGVIRRARVWSWLLPSGNWQSTAVELSALVGSEPPPLTV